MFITFDYRCRECGHQEERFVKRPDMDEQRCRVLDHEGSACKSAMTRLPAGTRTTFRYADTRLKD